MQVSSQCTAKPLSHGWISSTWCVEQEGRAVPPYRVDIERLAEVADDSVTSGKVTVFRNTQFRHSNLSG
jgi:hypothetical protein